MLNILTFTTEDVSSNKKYISPKQKYFCSAPLSSTHLKTLNMIFLHLLMNLDGVSSSVTPRLDCRHASTAARKPGPGGTKKTTLRPVSPLLRHTITRLIAAEYYRLA